MRVFEKVKESIANKMRSFLKIHTANGMNFDIDELLDFDSNVAVNKIWYRGESYELSQLYKQLDDNQFSFWGSVPTAGIEIRKIHTGLPKTMVNILSEVVADDMQDVEFAHEADNSLWQDIAKENMFDTLIKNAIGKTLYAGDGAFKISIDTDISQLPIVEFFEADRIQLERKRGRITEIIFKTAYTKDTSSYILYEHYGKGYIRYELKNAYDKIVELDTIPQTAGLTDVEWDGGFMLAEYISFYASDKFEGRGQSVFDAKRDNFDALDEAWSQWMDALRAGRTKTYIPENLIPRNPNTGELIKSNTFDNRFIRTASAMSETDNGKVSTEASTIQHESYLSTYITALDLCLQGVISPSTLGIDTKKLDNAEAQREKEKATLYTRQTIVAELQRVLPALIQGVFYAYQTLNKLALEKVECDVTFGEYANPSFESQVETVGKAKTQGIMSIEASVDELYGDSRDDAWKKAEVERLKAEQGIVEMKEPAVNLDLGGVE
jgi:hypothetical protein